ncbi:MAG: DUF4136 domain-containing protein [Acidobacteriota bacterium]|jgi:hypothetical protein|nr:DUF4136 domain-containing protein [Acidobacteriota bacterium]
MRKPLIVVMILLVAGTVAATKMKAYVGYDKNVDLGSFKTFDYRDTLDASVIDKAPPVHEMIKLLIISKLQDGGMEWVEENPDVLVTYHTDQDPAMKTNVTLYSYSYSLGWWWSPLWGSGMDISSWSQGTLTVDIWNPKTDTLVWRGAVVGVIPEDPSPAKAQKTIEKALKLMSKEFHKMRNKDK